MRARRLVAAALLSGLLASALTSCGPSGNRPFSGWIEADLVFIGPDEAGRIETLDVREGDALAAGAPLFAVDAALQKADLRGAEAAVAEAKARLARLTEAQQRKEEIDVLEAQQRRAEAALALSLKELERQKELARKGVAAPSQLDAATANFNRDRAALEEIKRRIVVAGLSARSEDITAARQALASALARRDAAQTRLARRRVVSPAPGVVQKVYYRVGEIVPAGKPVIALLPPANMKVRFFVPQAVLPHVAPGDTVRVGCDGCAVETARVRFIASTAEYTPPVIYSREEREKLVFLIEAVPEHPERLRVGQPVDVWLDAAAATRR